MYGDALLVFNNARTYNKLPTEDVHYMANRVQVGGCGLVFWGMLALRTVRCDGVLHLYTSNTLDSCAVSCVLTFALFSKVVSCGLLTSGRQS